MSKMNHMKSLVKTLSEASRAYYQEDRELMSNLEYDKLYDELDELEKETGTILAGSPTQVVGYELLSELPKERHDSRMLSLDKTKDREALVAWVGNQEGLLSWKLDGLTIVLTYEDGLLVKGVTRGNGEIGEVITNNVKVFDNIPLKINATGTVVIRGEAVIKYSDFKAINADLSVEEQYKNPRNLCSGTVRQLNNEVTAKRHVNFFAFSLVSAYGESFEKKSEQLRWLEQLGFDVVHYRLVKNDDMLETIEWFAEEVSENDFASDGLVLTYDDIAYAQSLGATSKFPRHSIAFKWQDEIKTTTLTEVEWSASRTGQINPVAIFEPVDLEGTTVSRASLHNISILQELALGLGDRVDVYKANMIIPQIAENHTKSNTLVIPDACPVCGEETEIREVKDVKVLYCNNPNCGAKHIKGFDHFVSRDAMNIDGMSEATIEKLLAIGALNELSDIFRLVDFKDQIVEMEGFGERSYENLIKAIENARHPRLENFIYALGILNVGLSNARLLCRAFDQDIHEIMEAEVGALEEVEGYGEVIAKSIFDYFHDQDKRRVVEALLGFITFEAVAVNNNVQVLDGKTFVITGSLESYENRKALKNHIETLGGKVTGTVTGKTDYLINNNVSSTTGKNKKAQELGVPIISEDDFIEMIRG